MTVEIKDKDKVISIALRAAGYKVDYVSVETILNIIDHVRAHPHTTTLFEIVQIQHSVKGLFEE